MEIAVQRFDTVGWVTGRASAACKKYLAPTTPNGYLKDPRGPGCRAVTGKIGRFKRR